MSLKYNATCHDLVVRNLRKRHGQAIAHLTDAQIFYRSSEYSMSDHLIEELEWILTFETDEEKN